MARRYQIFLLILFAYVLLVLVWRFVGVDLSFIDLVLGSDRVLFLKRAGYFEYYCFDSGVGPGGCSEGSYYISPISWIHLLLIIVLFTFSVVTDWLLNRN